MEPKILLIIIGLLCFCTAIIFMVRTNSLSEHYDIYSGSNRRQIQNSKMLSVGFLVIGLILELIVIWL